MKKNNCDGDAAYKHIVLSLSWNKYYHIMSKHKFHLQQKTITTLYAIVKHSAPSNKLIYFKSLEYIVCHHVLK